MEKAKGARMRTNGWGMLFKMAWIDLVLLMLGVAALGAGLFVRARPEWSPREDIAALNKGVMAFNAPPGLLPPGDGRPAEYPIQRAQYHWERAAALSTDKNVKALAYYDLGTLVGRESWAQALPGEGHARSDMLTGIKQLGESLRADPTNEDAKFNLELMEKAAKQEGTRQGGPGPGYSPGSTEKGY